MTATPIRSPSSKARRPRTIRWWLTRVPDLVNPNFINLTDTLPADQRYSFIFEGTPQAIDHFIINTVATSFLQRYHIARNNTDFPEVPGSLFAE